MKKLFSLFLILFFFVVTGSSVMAQGKIRTGDEPSTVRLESGDEQQVLHSTTGAITNMRTGNDIGSTTQNLLAANDIYFQSGFEEAWTFGAPSGWTSTPVTDGNNTWHRTDFIGTWTSASTGAYTPISFMGGASARFHTWSATAGSKGTIETPNIDLSSATDSVFLSFWWTNPTGQLTVKDTLNIYYSTNGGANYTKLGYVLTTGGPWYRAYVALPNYNSATTKIKFEAYSDFGNDDIGLDEVIVYQKGSGYSGTASLPGTFTSFTDAARKLSLYGVSGPLTINVAAGTYQDSLTFPSIPGTNSTNTITFVNSGGTVTVQRKGARVITGAAATGERIDDAVISLWGADYMTFDGINISNSSGATGTEWGYHVRVLSPTDGANNNTIKNCLIQMSKTNVNSRGIRHFPFWVLTAQTGASSNNKYYNNDIQSCGWQGILLQGQGGGTSASFFDLNNEIGSVGGTARVFDIGGGIGSANGIALTGQNGAKLFGVQFDSIWATSGAVNALLLGATTTTGDSTINVEVYNNTFNRITQTTGSASSIVTAIRIPGQPYNIRAKIYNNFISNLKSNGTSANAIDAIYNQGNNNAGSKIEWYFNTIYLNNQLIGVNGASQVMRIDASTSVNNLIIKNNVFVNKSKINGTGKNYIINRTGGTFTANNNAYYIDTTLANNYFGFYTSDRKGFGTWKNATSQDGSSAFEDVTFINSATIPYDLHINTIVPTQIESGGTTIAGITTDIDGNTRNVATPDIGADEGSFTLSSDVTPPAISYTLLPGTTSLSNRSFTAVAITDLSGVNVTPGTKPRCYYKKTTDSNEYNNNGAGTDGWKYVEANGSSTPFDFTIDYSLLNGGGGVTANDTVQYFVVAEDLAGSPNVGINSGAFAVAPTTCNLDPTAFPIGGTINRYAIIGAPLSGTYTVGLSLMRTHTGKDLKYEARTRKVKVMVPDENALNRTNEEKDPNADVPNTSSAFDKEALNRPMKQVEVEETYYEITENGRKYDGPMYMEYPNGNTKSTNRPGSVNSGNTDLLNHYATITAAVNDLNGRGVSGAVTFLLVDNSYTEAGAMQFNNNISGISATNTVTIRPQTGVTATVSASVNNGGIFKILSNYITIDGSNSGGSDQSLTLQNTSTTTPSVVHIGSTGTTPITNVMVKNCLITNGANTGSAVVVADASILTNGGYFNTITIQNNQIKKSFHGIYVNGGTTPQNGLNLFVTGNTISSTGADASTITGVYVQGVNGGNISQNDVGNMVSTMTTTGSRSGIWLATGCNNITIERNKLHDLQYTGTFGYGANGVRISNGGTSATGIVVKNNMIYNVTGDADSYATFGGSFSPVGIFCYGSAQTGISIHNNSINLYGNTLNYGINSYSIGIALDDGSIADVRNNMISNTLGLLGGTGAGALCVALETNASQLSNSNYNCYYSNPSTGVKGLIKIGNSGTNHLTMTALRTATGKDQLSFNSQPLFVSNTDLHILPADLTLSGRGNYIAGNNNDYDGDARATGQSTTQRPVDVGCDQYTPNPLSYGGNILIPVSGIYYDGDLIAVEVTSGSLAGQVRQFPGVRTPNNTLLKNGNDIKMESPVKNSKGSEQKNNSTKRSGTSGGQTDAMAVNTPWIYWELDNLSGATEPVTVRFYYNEDQLATISEANLVLSYWNGSAWDNNFVQSINAGNNYIELTLPTGLGWGGTSLFAIADVSAPLPVVLSSFDAAVMKRDVSLSWATESEINNQGFSVERRIKSQDNRYSEWKEVAFVEGKGNTTTRQTYNYSDKKLNSGTYQYRLKQVDFNGNYEYHSPSNNADLVIGKPGVFDISQNYPNPSNPTSNIDFQMPFDGKVSLRVYDILGKEVATLVDGYRTADFYTAKFDGTNLSTGVYFYRIIADNGTEKFTKTLKMILVK